MRAYIEYRETSRALNCKEKIGLKLQLGKCGKIKNFQIIYNFCGIFFQFALKIVQYPLNVTKIAIFLKKKSLK